MRSVARRARTVSAFVLWASTALGTGALSGCSSSGDGGASPHEDNAILSRKSRDTYACSVERAHTRYEPTQNGMRGPSLAVTTGGKAFLARLDHPLPYPDPNVGDPELFVAPLGLDGVIGTRIVPDDRSAAAWGPPAIGRHGDGLAVAWFDESKLRVATLGPDGAVSKGPVDVPGASIQDTYGIRPQVVQGADGSLAIAYLSYAFSGQGNSELRLVILDDDLTPKAPARVVDQVQSGYVLRFNLIATDDGYALLRTGAGAGERFDVYFESLDAAGSARGTPQLLTKEGPGTKPFGFFETVMLGLVRVSGGFLASWVEYFDRSTVVRVGRLDARGALKEAPVLLSNSEDAVDVVEPAFLKIGDAVALLSARGAHIFECGGCVPDHRIELLLIDPETLDPLSDVVSLERTALEPGLRPSGGLLGRDAVVLDSRILTAYLQQFHTTADLASATFACEPR